jgi:hypothetical protein
VAQPLDLDARRVVDRPHLHLPVGGPAGGQDGGVRLHKRPPTPTRTCQGQHTLRVERENVRCPAACLQACGKIGLSGKVLRSQHNKLENSSSLSHSEAVFLFCPHLARTHDTWHARNSTFGFSVVGNKRNDV